MCSHPSKIWRAIVDGRDMMKMGAIMRIGDGRSTNIWQHNWIPRAGMMRPISSLIHDTPEVVSDLIDASSTSWREELTRQVFAPMDAEAILRIPICTSQVDHFWALSEDPRGLFSVRTAYKMIYRIKSGREAWLEEGEHTSNLLGLKSSW